MLSFEVQELIKKFPNSWQFCFEIHCKNGKDIRLTEASYGVQFDGKEFSPYSGLYVKTSIFDDSGHGEIIVEGCFEEKGINYETELVDTKISIYFYLREINKLEKYLIYYCHEFIKNSLSFSLRLFPITKKYESTVTQFYSTRCRARFGDEKCGMDKERFVGESCDKTFRICCNKYNNAVNFRGEPFIPYLGYYTSRNDE